MGMDTMPYNKSGGKTLILLRNTILLGMLFGTFLGTLKADSLNPNSQILWGDINALEWLDFQKWKKQALSDSKLSPWEEKVSSESFKEQIGYMVGSVGEVSILRGRGEIGPSLLTKIFEGDQIETGEKSYAWIYLIDGTLVRLSPYTSVSLIEYNWGEKENLFFARMNYGHSFWFSRDSRGFRPSLFPETDVLYQESLERPTFLGDVVGKAEFRRFKNLLGKDLRGKQDVVDLYAEINQSISYNQSRNKHYRKTKNILLFPNGTIYGENLRLEAYYSLGSKTYFSQRPEKYYFASGTTAKPLQFMGRGYKAGIESKIEAGKWFITGERGRELKELASEMALDKGFRLSEVVTKRFPRLALVRELLFEKYSLPLFNIKSSLLMAKRHQYKYWRDSKERFEYLLSHSRRAERKNLFALKKLKQQNKLKIKDPLVKLETWSEWSLLKYFKSLEQSDGSPFIEATELVPVKKRNELFELIQKTSLSTALK